MQTSRKAMMSKANVNTGSDKVKSVAKSIDESENKEVDKSESIEIDKSESIKIDECENMELDLDNALYVLVKKHSFYANLLYQMRINKNNKIPTAGIRLDNQLIMEINPKFFNNLKLDHQVGVLMHELDHVIHGHILGFQFLNISPRFGNIAADLAINQHNKYLQDFEDCLHLDKFCKDHNIVLDSMRSMAYYARKIEQHVKENPEKYKGDGSGFGDSMDDHSGWQDGDDSLDAEHRKGVVQKSLEKAIDSTESGNVPGSAQEMLDKIKRSSQVNWKQVLRKFVQQSQTTKYKFTRNRRNRRTGLAQPGKRQMHKLRIAACIDTSGSVSNDELKAFTAEIKKIVTLDTEITVITYDYVVQDVYPLTRNTEIVYKGRGGTNHAAALEEAKKLKVDAVFMFTDGDMAEVPEKFKKPVLWVLTNNGTNPSNFGKSVNIKA